MKSLIALVLFFISAININAQEYSCAEVYEYVKNNYDYKDGVTCFNSSMLVKVEYYKIDDSGFVVAYIKQNDYDLYGNPYLFCGISSSQWSYFKSEGMINSWGKSFHKYIMDYTCNCR